MEPMLESGPGMTARAPWVRPDWVLTLGIYGRAAYEWQRATAPFDPTTLDQLGQDLRALDRELADQVRLAVQERLTSEDETEAGTWASLPVDGSALTSEDLVLVTVALEIDPCLERVFQPALGRGAPFANDTWPSPQQRQLLETRSWIDRPSLDQLRDDASALAQAIEAHGDDPVILESEGLVPATLVEPTALPPTELRVVHQTLRRHLGRPVDLYLLFN